MAIKGSLKEASLTDVLQLLTMGGKRGCLSVTDGQSFGYIYFDEGRIIYASLLNRRDRLGDILIREGVISRQQLEEAIEEQSRSRDGRRLGEILIAKAYVERDTLTRYLIHQIEEAVYHLFTWSQGTFYFEPGQLPEGEELLAAIDPESLLLEGARRVDEWSQIEKKIPSLDIIFALDSERSAAISSLKLTEEQELILPYLDGDHSVWQIIDETALGEFNVGKALYGLITAGLVRRAGRRERSTRPETQGRIEEHRNLGIAFYRTGMYAEAEREFKRVLAAEPQSQDAEFFLALLALRQGDYGQAEKRFRDLIERGARRAALFNNLAFVLAATGRTMDALSVLDEGLKKASDHPRLHLSKAMLHLRLGDPAGAKSALAACAEALSDVPSALYYSLLTLAEGMSADLDAAVRACEEGLRRHPTAAALANNAGVVYERKGFHERARELYERAFELDSALPQASKNIGDILYRGGMYEQAAPAYERAIRVNPGMGDDVYAKLGNVYYKAREREKAVTMWKRALEHNPMNEVVRTNLEFVEGAAGAEG